MKPNLPALMALTLLAGCVSSGKSGAISALPDSVRANARIASVELQNTPRTGVSATFNSDFERSVQTKVDGCTTGQSALTLQVTLDGYHAPNFAHALFAPSESQISGVARLIDASGAVVGEYRIQRSLIIGGVLGAVAAANAERTMSEAFGDELCKQAFRRR